MPVATIPTREIVKEALLVGVNYATNTNLTENGFLIQAGAHKDTMNLRKLLIDRYGYRDDDITTLVDSEDVPHDSESWPTRENIMSAMEKLIAGKQPGDHIVFSFSGHGGQVQALVDLYEVDGMDEILLPVDCALDPESPDWFVNFIRDDEIRDIFVNQLSEGVRCTMIFDCCHSGTASDLPSVETLSPVTTPDSPFFSPRATAPRAPRAFARMDTLHDGHVDSAAYMRSIARNGAYPQSFQDFDKVVTSWSACLDKEITFGKKSGGIFMKAFTQVLHSTPNPTHKELLKILRERILHVTKDENQKLEKRRNADLLSHGSDLLEDFVAPKPQLGSLRPESILLARFTL